MPKRTDSEKDNIRWDGECRNNAKLPIREVDEINNSSNNFP